MLLDVKSIWKTYTNGNVCGLCRKNDEYSQSFFLQVNLLDFQYEKIIMEKKIGECMFLWIDM